VPESDEEWSQEDWDDERPEWRDDSSKHRERSPGDISAAEKYEFLHLVRQGLNRKEAANMLGYKGRHFRSICSPLSMFYDEEFAAEYGQVIGSVEFAHNHLERLRDAATERALGGSDRILEKLLMIHDPDWKVLREREVNVNIRQVLEMHFRSLPTERLEQLLSWMDEMETIDATEVRELPPAEAA
jgi:hypothetical protein